MPPPIMKANPSLSLNYEPGAILRASGAKLFKPYNLLEAKKQSYRY